MNSNMKRLLRVMTVLGLLYLFLVSIKLMGSSFKLFGKDFAEGLIASCSNPFTALFIGILTTSVIQSSSTTTSIVVGLVGGGVLSVNYAIPIIMGANIGTSITNTLVSLTFVTRKEDFKRAFAGATVHDFFNLSSVLLFFPLELRFHFIEKLAIALTKVFEGVGGLKFTSPLKLIIDPAVHTVKDLLLKAACLPEITAGVIMLVASVIVMATSLIYLVKTMRSLVVSQAEVFIDKYIFRNDFAAGLLGLCLTVAVQSSSITTSLIVPLVGAGMLSLRRCYPFTLGANVGTTCTAILASLATVSMVNGHAVNTAGITAAFAHLMFNVCGIAVFYPLKRLPIYCAKKLAELASESKRWVLIFVLGVFFVLPLLIIFATR